MGTNAAALCVDGLLLRTAYLQRTKDRGAATQSASTASPERLEKLERHLPSMVIRLEQVLYSEAASQVCVLCCAAVQKALTHDGRALNVVQDEYSNTLTLKARLQHALQLTQAEVKQTVSPVPGLAMPW